MNKEQTIQHYMKKLGIDHDEAEQMWLDEQEDNLPELTKEQKAVEKEMMRADRKKETTPRKHERKPDADKRILIDHFWMVIKQELTEDVAITNPEREIEFVYNGNKYRLTLSKPRK